MNQRSIKDIGVQETRELYKTILDNIYDGVYFADRSRRITYWNKGAERISGFEGSEVIGRSCSENILVHVNSKGVNLCKNMCPLAKTIRDGKTRETEAFLHHKNGHRVPVAIRTTPLRDSTGKIVGAVEIFNDNSSQMALRQRFNELQEMALYDELTGIANRRYIEMNLKTRFGEMRRYGRIFGVLFIDIDHFKEINDTYGHDVGDRVLKMVADTLVNNLRAFDILGRWGGEEFVSVVVNVNEELLSSIAHRFRFLVEQSRLSVESVALRVTVSIGATLARPKDTVKTLMKRADRLMYRSKQLGRNRVCISMK